MPFGASFSRQFNKASFLCHEGRTDARPSYPNTVAASQNFVLLSLSTYLHEYTYWLVKFSLLVVVMVIVIANENQFLIHTANKPQELQKLLYLRYIQPHKSNTVNIVLNFNKLKITISDMNNPFVQQQFNIITPLLHRLMVLEDLSKSLLAVISEGELWADLQI